MDSTAFYHEDQLEGLVRVCRMMLYYKYPRYFEDGALAFTESLPTIYSSVISPLGIVQHLCKQLGLPLACIRPVPVNTHFGKTIYLLQIIISQKKNYIAKLYIKIYVLNHQNFIKKKLISNFKNYR